MGMNFYAQVNSCPHCGRCDEENRVHLGKQSAGWAFSFRGFSPKFNKTDWLAHQFPCLKGAVIDSLASWLNLVNRPDVIVKDEYGFIHEKPIFIFNALEKREDDHHQYDHDLVNTKNIDSRSFTFTEFF